VSGAGVRVGIGTRVWLDGEVHEIIEWLPSGAGNEVVLRGARSVCRMSVVALLSDQRVRLIPERPGPQPDDDVDTAATALLGLNAQQLAQVNDRAGHVREVLSGHRLGHPEAALPGEPRREFDPVLPLRARYQAKAAELGVDCRTVRRWVRAFREHGEAGLVPGRGAGCDRVDPVWAQTALAIMAEYTEESQPSQSAVILQTRARLAREIADGVVVEPSRASAYRKLAQLDGQHPTFHGTTKRNRDIAGRPPHPYGKLRPTRPGEYLILDTTRLDVFALDPATLRWVQVELSAAMDWYTRCIVGLRLTPVSTKAVDAAALMYQVFRPPPAPAEWPDYAVWPAHGIPEQVLIDPDRIDRTGAAVMSPPMSPGTIVVDHGKIYLSEHLSSVCARMGISIQPARIREGRDKAPLERFFKTVRLGLLQYLAGYKGPDVNARGLDVESHSFFYLDQLEAMVREWVATVYHHRRHRSLLDPGLPAVRMSPAQMFAHGMVRAGYLHAPRDPQLAYEFLRVVPRTIQHDGIHIANLVYKGAVLGELAELGSPYTGRLAGRWPIHVDPDDISRVFVRHPSTRDWHELVWEHAREVPMPFSEDTLHFARRLGARRHGFVDDRLALTELLARWQIAMGASPAERRIALRLARAEAALSKQVSADDAAAAAEILSRNAVRPPHPCAAFGGDDDDDAELHADYDPDEPDDSDDEPFGNPAGETLQWA